MYASVKSAGVRGLSAELVTVEVDLSSGLPRFDLVGLPNSAVRVQGTGAFRGPAAASSSHQPHHREPGPATPGRAIYDLPSCSHDARRPPDLRGRRPSAANSRSCVCRVPESSLRGDVRRVRGVLPMLICARQDEAAFIPAGNAQSRGLRCHGRLSGPHGGTSRAPAGESSSARRPSLRSGGKQNVRGRTGLLGSHRTREARRALEIAAAGNFAVLLVGPPGAGKSMLPKAAGHPPAMTYDEALETTNIYSVGGLLPEDLPLMVESVLPGAAPHGNPARDGGRRFPGEPRRSHARP